MSSVLQNIIFYTENIEKKMNKKTFRNQKCGCSLDRVIMGNHHDSKVRKKYGYRSTFYVKSGQVDDLLTS